MSMLKVGRPDDDKDDFISHSTVMYYVVEHDNNGKFIRVVLITTDEKYAERESKRFKNCITGWTRLDNVNYGR